MLESSQELDQANNIIQFPISNTTPSNIEEFKKLFLENKLEVIDAFTDELMSEIIRICYAYGYLELDPKDISYLLIALKSMIMRHEDIHHSFHDRIDSFIESHYKINDTE